MKPTILLALVVMCCAGPAFGQGGWIGVYSDAEGLNCSLRDDTPGLVPFFVIHNINNPPITTARIAFSAPNPDCSTLQYLQDSPVYSMTVGNSQTEVSITYPTCQTGSNLVLVIQYLGDGTTPPCCIYPIMPAPSLGFVRTEDCASQELSVIRRCHPINPNNLTCPCNHGQDNCPAIVPVETSTWGGVKALYQ